MKSLIVVQPGTELELCIFPGDDSNPIMIDGAVVRWTQPSEFGLSFVAIRAPFLRRLTEVWKNSPPRSSHSCSTVHLIVVSGL